MSTQHVPVCAFKTSQCVLAPRAHVFQHVRVVPAYTGTCGSEHTGGEGREREGSSSASFFIRKTSVFWTSLEHLNRMWFTKSNYWIFHILRKGRAQSLNAPLLPVAMYSSYETGTLFRLFVQRPSRHFSLALSSSFYFSMTTQREGPRHKDKEHPTNNDARHTT